MKSRIALAGIAVASVVAGPLALATPAAAAPTKVTVVNAYSYSASSSFDFTVCVGDSLLTSLPTTGIDDQLELEAGPTDIRIFDGIDADCTGSEPSAETTVTIPEGPSSTLVLYWPVDTSTPAVAVFADDLSCTPAGNGRLAVRNAALTSSEGGYTPLDLTATAPGGAPITLASALPIGEETVQTLPAGVYADLAAVPHWDDLLQPDALDINEGIATTLYLFAGADGPIGGIVTDNPVDVCSPETTTTTTVASTTTAAPATPATATPATPVAASPRYTG